MAHLNDNFNEGLTAFRNNKKAVLLDVRTPEEYNTQHIGDSINIPIQSLENIVTELSNLSTIYVYCHSGARSKRAAEKLRRMGYTDVTDIGGIIDYKYN